MRMLRQWGGIVDICPDASPIDIKLLSKDFTLIVVGAQEALILVLEEDLPPLEEVLFQPY